MRRQLEFLLTRPARKKGGDRYETQLETGEVFTIYIPQDISRRANAAPDSQLTIIISNEKE